MRKRAGSRWITFLISWLFKHAALLRTILQKGLDGKAAHQRTRGIAGTMKLVLLGQIVKYKCRAQEAASLIIWRFSIGVW